MYKMDDSNPFGTNYDIRRNKYFGSKFDLKKIVKIKDK